MKRNMNWYVRWKRGWKQAHIQENSGGIELAVASVDVGPGGRFIDDAHLLSAAGEMFDALEQLLLVPNKRRPDEVWDAARAAIAKAKGEMRGEACDEESH